VGEPPTGIIKLNWDAALDRKNNKMRVGPIVRDSSREVLIALSTIVPFIYDFDVAVVVVAWKAVVNGLRHEAHCCNRFGQLIEDTKIRIHSLQTY
jgi:hypothetical protein